MRQQPHLKYRLLLLTALLFISMTSHARVWYFDQHTYISKQPTIDAPYVEITLNYFDASGDDSYFDNSAPIVTLDGKDLVALTELDKCTVEKESGGANWLVKQANGGWLPKTYTASRDGVNYRIRLYNPRRGSDNSAFYVTVVIVPDKMEWYEQHTYGIRGKWRHNRGKGYTADRSWESGKVYMVGTPYINCPFKGAKGRPAYNKYEFDMEFDERVGDTTIGTNYELTGAPARKRDYINPSDLKSTVTVEKGTSKRKVTLDVNTVAHESKYMWVQYSYTTNPKENDNLGKTVVYHWTNIRVPGFPKALYPTVETNQWKKQISMNWNMKTTWQYSEDTYSGTWAVFRRRKDGNSWGTLERVRKDKMVNTSCIDDEVEYDTDYRYFITFIPTGASEDSYYDDLTISTNVRLERKLPITIDSIVPGEGSITPHWTVPELAGSDQYTFYVYRAPAEFSASGAVLAVTEDKWENVGSVRVTNKKQTKYFFKDTKNLESCQQYYYKIEIEAMENKIFSSGTDNLMAARMMGESEVTSVSTSKGDYTGVVKVSWTAKQIGTGITKYEVARRLIGSNVWNNIYTVSGTAKSYYFEDNTAPAGNYYQYRVRSITECGEDGQQSFVDKFDDGFCRSTGTLSGRVSYGEGTAVGGVKVILSNSDSTINQFHSIQTTGAGSGIRLTLNSADDKKAFANDYSVQMLINPNKDIDVTQTDAVFFCLDDDVKLMLGNKTGTTYPILLASGTSSENTGISLETQKFTSLTLTHNSAGTFTLTAIDASDSLRTYESSLTSSTPEISSLCFGGTSGEDTISSFAGHVDEMRIFSGKALKKEDILKNYNHPLNGAENALFLYWPVDEGIDKQQNAYDYSKTNGVANGRHGNIVACNTSKTVPLANQFSLFTLTDNQGNYTLRGVPFSGEGTTYTITPQMGTHSFTPIYTSRFVGGSALVYSSVDFTDNSSFEVNGKIYYSGTTIPVEGCMVYVDGTVASRNGQVVKTDEEGTFSVDVPIGRHYIEVKKDGHEFENNGRYPADPGNTGETFVCEKKINGLLFKDTTLVNFTGHFVGGNIEAEKPLGFKQSKNNIGQTLLTLECLEKGIFNAVESKSSTTISYNDNPKTSPITSNTPNILSTSYRGAGNNSKFVYIKTDSITGEFSAMLPPLRYSLNKVEFTNSVNPYAGQNLLNSEPRQINLSDPLQVSADTVGNETYSYHTALKDGWYTPAVFSVTQQDNNVGAFGIKECTVNDSEGSFDVNVYSYDQSGDSVKYSYDYPLFKSMDKYTFILKGYEVYRNYDVKTEFGTTPTDTVPLSGTSVTISNALSADQIVYKEDNSEGGIPGQVHELKTSVIELDSLGMFTYTWKAGLPNITEPYTRAIQFYYYADGATKQWKPQGLEAVILGSLPTGNNFVTKGPDVIDMVLRDPPGTCSSASWTKGTTYTKFKSHGSVWDSKNTLGTVAKCGFTVTFQAGSIGYMIETENENKHDEEVGVIVKTQGENATSWTRSITTERTISTSSAPEFIGANGDVFIGSSTNIIFGDAREVALFRTKPGEKTAQLDKQDVTTTGLSFGTEFQYTANFIENTLIPNLYKVRNAWLTRVPKGTAATFKNTSDTTMYITELSPDDPRFGSDNDDKEVWGEDSVSAPTSTEGYSYRMVKPESASNNPDDKETDKIMEFNNSIKNWIMHLRNNEEQKVKAFENREKYIKHNLSFDAGSSVSMTQTTDTTRSSSHDATTTLLVHTRLATGVKVNDCGVEAYFETETGGGAHNQSSSSTQEISSFTYTLAEDGDDDALTVDVYDYGSWGPIFRTRGGQTSAPYEGEVQTSYYLPNNKPKTIMEATMQIEVPEITVDNLKWSKVSNVPSGGSANYTLRLRNNSETQEDVYYKLLVNGSSNSKGAKISIDGKVLDENGTIIKVPATETVVKSLQLSQTNQSILNYDSITIVLASQSQYDCTSTWDVIADSVFISTEFAPSSSDVRMTLDKSVINTITNDTLGITFDQFDRNYAGLKAFRIQSYAPGATNWLNIKEYVINAKDTSQTAKLLPDAASVTYYYNMHGLSDGNYRFRVLSVSSYGGEEITLSSKEIDIVKDMAKPKPLGMPQPSNGVLGIGDDISITFNEEIVKGEIASDDNFEITGILNGAKVDHNTALALQGNAVTAATEASFSLSNKSFSTDMWLLATGAGTILSHGSGSERFTLALDDDMHLKVSVGNDTHTSLNSVPRNSWSYLTVSYTANGEDGTINATVANDASTINLFTDCSTTAYKGNGTLTIGENMSGAINELALWDVAHDNTEAQRERQKTKQPSTPNLLGYWKMNEGEGRTITDYAQNRHLIATGDSWYINNKNKAVELDGSAYVSFLAGDLAASQEDNQAAELWIRAGKQDGEAQILQIGKVELWTNAEGLLKLTTNDNTYDAGTQPLTDNSWHHVAMNILRSGNAAVYVDGVRTLALPARNVGSMNTDSVLIGARRRIDAEKAQPYSYDRKFKGQIDEIRLWNATLDASTLARNRKLRLTGSEDGLTAYFPFETKTLDSGGQIATTPTDTCIMPKSMGRKATYGGEALTFTDIAPALQAKPVETNVAFSFTTSNDKLVININEDPAIIEGCTLNFKVKRVRDVNGNTCEPVCWSAYVNRNSLAWTSDNASITQKAGEESTIKTTVSNKGGTQQEWTLSGVPQWLKASVTAGTTEPLSTTSVNFTVGKSCPIGKHFETIYLVNADGIATPLPLSITVTGEMPDWKVETDKFSTTMNLVATVSVHGVPSNDTDNIIGAFIDGECRGVAQPTYSKRYDEYFAMLDIAGNAGDKGKKVEFRLYEAATGITWPDVQASQDVSFSSGTVIGSFGKPVNLNALDRIEQTLVLNGGWNWTSISVLADDMNATAVMSDVANATSLVKSKTSSIMRYNGIWDGGDIAMNNREMYKVLMTSPAQLTLRGSRPGTSEKTINVRPGWNWIGYNGTNLMGIADAFAALSPEDGDIVKGKQGFAIYDGYEWAGSLEALTPGQGYMYLSQATTNRTFRYPANAAQPMLSRSLESNREASIFSPIDDSKYPGNMTIVGRVTYNGLPLSNIETGVFVNAECRTHNFTDNDGIVFLTVPGDADETLSFLIPYGGEVIKAEVTLRYEDDKVEGNRGTPFEIAFDGNSLVTDISGITGKASEECWYTTDGVKLKQKPTVPGVYIRVTTGNNSKSEKIVIN